MNTSKGPRWLALITRKNGMTWSGVDFVSEPTDMLKQTLYEFNLTQRDIEGYSVFLVSKEYDHMTGRELMDKYYGQNGLTWNWYWSQENE